MAYFTKDFVQFFTELEKNNNREWFTENKKRFENSVKKPFHSLVSDVIMRMADDDPEIKTNAKDAIFRIYRDVRFSKDKTPYKLNVSAMISARGKKDHSYPGLYFEMKKTGVTVYGGIYGADKELLYKIRSFIANNLDDFRDCYSDEDFRSTYGEILGDKNKVIAKEFRDLIPTEPLILNKQFYFNADIPKSIITSDELLDKIIETYNSANRLNAYLKRAVLSA
jgi:uncharacterized protein (TIGR02453 family)